MDADNSWQDEWEDEWDEQQDQYSFNPQQQLSQLQRGISYQLMNQHQIMHRQITAIEKVKDLFGLTHTQSAQLLIKHEWNTNKVCQDIVDGTALQNVILQRWVSKIPDQQQTLCITCLQTRLGKQMKSLQCGHIFCELCYSQYLKQNLTQGLISIFTTCPMDGCQLIVPQQVFQQVLPPDLFKKYQRFLLRSFVQLNKGVKWCPAPDCQYAVQYPKKRARDIICKCGYSWCFGCGNDSHNPLSCQFLQKWTEMEKGGMEDQWILANTKACPGCQSHIQKNMGCMHMTCKCGHQFCWLCLGNWSEHGDSTGGFYKCNKFSEKQKRGEYSELEKQRAIAAYSVEKYDHYYNRFMDHRNSWRMAQNTKKETSVRLDGLCDILNVSITKFQFIVDALSFIIKARKQICYTYPYGYFLNSISKVRYYEFLQGQLEYSLELLDIKTQVDFDNFIELNEVNQLMLKQEFYNFKAELNSVLEAVKQHFQSSIKDMEEGLLSVDDIEESEFDERLVNEMVMGEISDWWTCPACTFANENTRENCEICNTNRPGNQGNYSVNALFLDLI